MKTFPILNQDGSKRAFEVENLYIGVRTICEILQSDCEVVDLAPRRLFSSHSDIHIRFKYRGKDFIVWEPYGDSSRCWIGEESDAASSDLLSQIELKFIRYKPKIFRKIIGDILSLNFLTSWIKKGPT